MLAVHLTRGSQLGLALVHTPGVRRPQQLPLRLWHLLAPPGRYYHYHPFALLLSSSPAPPRRLTCMVGYATPSPRPIRARTAMSGPSPITAAGGVRMVKADQNTTPHDSTSLGE